MKIKIIMKESDSQERGTSSTPGILKTIMLLKRDEEATINITPKKSYHGIDHSRISYTKCSIG